MRRVLARWAPHTPRKPRFRPTKQRVPYQPAVVEQAGLGAGSTSVGAAGIEAGLAEDDFDFHYVEAPERPQSPALVAEAARLQSQISHARSVGHLAEILSSHEDQLDALHAASAFHRLARLGQLTTHPTLLELLSKRLAEPEALHLGAQAQVSLLCALARLTVRPPWLVPLLVASEANIAEFSGHQLATALYALARLEAKDSVSLQQEEVRQFLESLHRELQRRQRALGPGGTSAMDTVLMADSLAKLQIRDEPLFTALAIAITKHLDANQLKVREVRHTASAFAQMAVLEKQLMSKMMNWLQPQLRECSSTDLSALAFAFSRFDACGEPHRAFYTALGPEVQKRFERQRLSPLEAASLIVSFSQASALRDHAEQLMSMTPLIERSPNALNGHWLAMLLPCISHIAQAPLMDVLAERTSQLAPTLSPRQLARVAIAFGSTQRSTKLWQCLIREAMSKVSAFSAPDTLRLLAGMDAAGVVDRKLLKTFWARVETKQAKYLVEEILALLRLWPRLPADVRSDELPRALVKNLRSRLEKTTRGVGWSAPPQLALELLEWLPSSRRLDRRDTLDLRLLRAMLLQLPRQLGASSPELRLRLLQSLTRDAEILEKCRRDLQEDQQFQRAVANLSKETPADALGAEWAFHCAQLGMDVKELHDLLERLLQQPLPLPLLGQVCWASAELRLYREVQKAMKKLIEELPEGDDAVAWLRLAWSSLACGNKEIEPFLRQVKVIELLPMLSPCDLRPLQQLAWHCRQHPGDTGSGDTGCETEGWCQAVLDEGPKMPSTSQGSLQTDAEKRLSKLLQNLRVPHVVASSQAVPGSIYRLPVWFPAANAVLDLNVAGDRLMSGKASGTADMRRRQLQEVGLTVHRFDTAQLRGLDDQQQLARLASAVAPSCIEAQQWLDERG